MSSMILFKSQKGRRTWNEIDQKWCFSVQDALGSLAERAGDKQYIKIIRTRDPELNSYWGTICTPVGKNVMRKITREKADE